MTAGRSRCGRRRPFTASATAASPRTGPALAWSLRGEEAVLSEAPEADSYTRPERELLRCIRVRGALATAAHAWRAPLSRRDCGRFAAVRRPFSARTLTPR